MPVAFRDAWGIEACTALHRVALALPPSHDCRVPTLSDGIRQLDRQPSRFEPEFSNGSAPRKLGTNLAVVFPLAKMATETPGATHSPTRSVDATTDDGSFTSAVVDTRTGLVLGAEAGTDPAPLADFASALPELFRAADVSERLQSARLDAAAPAGMRDLVLVSPRRVHVAQRLPRDPELAVVCVASRTASLGWIVAQARTKLTRA